jgi:hypothetical protein
MQVMKFRVEAHFVTAQILWNPGEPSFSSVNLQESTMIMVQKIQATRTNGTSPQKIISAPKMQTQTSFTRKRLHRQMGTGWIMPECCR